MYGIEYVTTDAIIVIIGGYENKHQIIVANEYKVIQLKLFTTTFVND